jgi:hypothetical protein
MEGNLFEFANLTAWAMPFTVKMVAACWAFLAAFIAIAFVYNIAITLFRTSGTKPFDLSKLTRVVVLAFTLAMYIPLSYGAATLMSTMEYMTRPGISKAQIAQTFVQDSYQERKAELSADGEYSGTDRIDAGVEGAKAAASTFSLSAVFGDAVNSIIKLSVRTGISLINSILIQVFFCLGPFALLFSILPGFEQKFHSWLSTYVTFLFVPVVFNILDGVMVYTYEGVLKSSSSLNMYMHGVYNVITLVLYILPYWIAGKVVGSSDAGRFLSQTGQLATMGAGKVGGMMTKMASSRFGGGGSSGSASAGNVADTAKDAFSK